MKSYFTKFLFLTLLVFSQLIFFSPPTSSAPYNNTWQIQQQATQRAAQVQRDAQIAAERARRNAQIAADKAKRNAQTAAERARKNADRTANNARLNANNAKLVNRNKNLPKNQSIQDSRNLQKQRAMDRVQKTIQNQKKKIANDNSRKIKLKLTNLKRIKQLRNRDRKNKQLAEKKRKEKKNNDFVIRQTLDQKLFQPKSNITKWRIPKNVSNKFPSSWGSKLNKKGVGTRWQDPNNPGSGVQIDKGNPNHTLSSQQVDHVIVRRKGQVIGRDGNPIQGSIRQNAEQAHIPLKEYQGWKSWHSP